MTIECHMLWCLHCRLDREVVYTASKMLEGKGALGWYELNLLGRVLYCILDNDVKDNAMHELDKLCRFLVGSCLTREVVVDITRLCKLNMKGLVSARQRWEKL